MHRKHFLSSLLPAAFALSSAKAIGNTVIFEGSRSSKIPPYLRQGDTIGITCPAGYITLEDIQPAVQLMQGWGFVVEVGKTVGKRSFTLGGTDEERAADLQYMLDNPNIKAIMCARGGYGAVRIIDQLNFHQFKTYPKWIIGFSDITVLHSHINRNYHIATLHSKMCNSFPADWNLAEPIQVETILSIKQALTGEKLSYTSPASEFNRLGKATGGLVGGNLSLLTSLSGSKSDINTKHKILFLEDTGEYLYNIDRMFYNLKRSGKLEHLHGLIIGGFKLKPDEPDEVFGKTVAEIVLEKVKEYDYPVCFDFPVGHQKNNFALKCGVEHLLEVYEIGGRLYES
ncbi:S66 peptidase family protein [Mucilaginibacter arboris]|uniref:LD-carboxypeptidase n=1 Tax=Mucilaginibacter arboris TaxID=2682090 RepID=A0A7K1SZC5_9SPHI|nr:LD-carboxypeptidase [Mucilaginibacter arboris]MVN22608.1 LD-carboxypeptidase [Mucilaginibacter arboris]